MWCSSCRQEVPGLVDSFDGRYGCPRCGAVLLSDNGIDLSSVAATEKTHRTDTRHPTTGAESAASSTPVFEPVRPPQAEPSRITSLRWSVRNWELNEKLRRAERLTAAPRRRYDPPAACVAPHAAPFAAPSGEFGGGRPPLRNDYYAVPQQPFTPPPYGQYYAPAPPPNFVGRHECDYHYVDDGPSRGAQILASLVSWLFLGSAITAFSCGGFLSAWGAVAERPTLQQLGMPIILVGVVLAVVGLLPQIFLRRVEERRRRVPSMHGTPQHATQTEPPRYP